jgi:hypothetical protein
MKLAGLVLVALLGGSGIAHADDRAPLDPYAHATPRPRAAKLRRMLLQQFDRNGDGRLGPRERRHAARVLRRLANRVQRGARADARKHRFIQRFDLNRDGNIGPGEMPPVLADELRPLDRDGDGWLHDNELP